MILDIARLLLFPALMAFAAASDLFTMTISNRVSLALVAGFVMLALPGGMGMHDLLMHFGAGAAVLEPVEQGGFLGFELGVDAKHGPDLCLPGGGSREPTSTQTVAQGRHWVEMNGREVFRVATRLMVSSAEQLLAELGATIDDVDLYVAHQANQRIIDHAAKHLGLPPEKVFLNIERYGNTSAASIPIGLAEAVGSGQLKPGMRVLMSAVGGGITWGSAFMEWSPNGNGA